MSKIYTVPVEGRTWRYVSVNMNQGRQVVYNGSCVFGGLVVSNSLSAGTCRIEDGTALLTAVAPSAPAGTNQIISPNGVEIKTSLAVNPDAGMTGRVTVLWQSVGEEKIAAILRKLPGELELREDTPPQPPEPEQPKRNSVFSRRHK